LPRSGTRSIKRQLASSPGHWRAGNEVLCPTHNDLWPLTSSRQTGLVFAPEPPEQEPLDISRGRRLASSAERRAVPGIGSSLSRTRCPSPGRRSGRDVERGGFEQRYLLTGGPTARIRRPPPSTGESVLVKVLCVRRFDEGCLGF
jgi:hypothetical protein